MWDGETGCALRTLAGHTRWINCVVYSPDGMRLASGSADKTVRLWDGQMGRALRTLTGHTSKVTCVAYSPDGMRIASGSKDETVRLWDGQTGSALRTLAGHTDEVTCVAYSPDGKTLASGSRDKTIRLWDGKTGSTLGALVEHTAVVTCVAYSPDGKTLASGTNDDSTVRLWNGETGCALRTLTGHTAVVTCVAHSPDGKTLASGSYDKTVRLWDGKTGSALRTLEGHTREVTCIAYSPDGKTLVSSGSWDKTVRLRDVETGRTLRTLAGHTNGVACVAYSPDGKTLASGSYDKTIRLWDGQTGDYIKKLTLWYSVDACTFSSQNRLAVAGDHGNLSLWHIAQCDASVSITLQCSANSSRNLSLVNANITQAIRLSDNDRQLFKQHKAEGNPAHPAQPYQPWCALFQPIMGTASVDGDYPIICTKDNKLTMSEDTWVVSVARNLKGKQVSSTNRNKKLKNDSESRKEAPKKTESSINNSKRGIHAFLIIEGYKHSRRFIIRAELTVPQGSSRSTIKIEPLRDIEDFQEKAQTYEAIQWNITPEEGNLLLKNIRDDQKRCIQYNIGGSKSALTLFSSAAPGRESQNCLSWCKKQLRLIDIELPDRWYHIFVVLPQDITSPNKGQVRRRHLYLEDITHKSITPKQSRNIDALITKLSKELEQAKSKAQKKLKNEKKQALILLRTLLINENYQVRDAINEVLTQHPKACVGRNSRVKDLFDDLLENASKSTKKLRK